MTSSLKRNSGTQKEWMTSAEASSNRIVWSVGTTRIGISVLDPTVGTGCPPLGVGVSGEAKLPFPLEGVARAGNVGVFAALHAPVLRAHGKKKQPRDDHE